MAKSKDGAASSIVIKRPVISGDGGHHGGAWKVAYADFVTAMMAFFLLMWLLNATTEKQKAGLADYFNPTLVQRPGATGDSTEDGVKHSIEIKAPDSGKSGDFENVARQVQDSLTGIGAESMQMENILRHVVTKITDEGLVIEIGDLTDQPLFVEDTAQPQRVLREIAAVLVPVLERTHNEIAISGHVRSYPDILVSSPVWALSDARAHTMRNLLEINDLPPQRVQRVTGYADRQNRAGNPMAPDNNRVEIILLR